MHSIVENEKSIKGCLAAALPFPPISWWKAALQADVLYLDPHEHFQKMTYRNRYYLAEKQGKALLSIPLAKGRNQHLAMKDMEISFAENWQKNHWRTLQTLLGNSPFFEYIDYQLFPFFQKKQNNLYEWNKASIQWANDFLGKPLDIKETATYLAETEEGILDLRSSIHPKANAAGLNAYYQVFQQDAGFIEDCSILDLICCEGKNALNILKS